MTEHYTEDQALGQVVHLTRSRLTALIDAGAIQPARGDGGLVFGAGDMARLALLSELADLYDMQPEALAVLITVIDQMHAARRDRSALLAAIAAETPEVQHRVVAVLVQG